MKDEKGLIVRKDKKKSIGEGRFIYVPYGQWKHEIIINPLGETAQMALREKDEDLNEVYRDNIPLKIFHEAEVDEAPKNRVVNLDENKSKVDEAELLRIKQLKDRGFKSTEESKCNR